MHAACGASPERLIIEFIRFHTVQACWAVRSIESERVTLQPALPLSVETVHGSHPKPGLFRLLPPIAMLDERRIQERHERGKTLSMPDSRRMVAGGDEGRTLELVRWDWQKPAKRSRGPPIINARIEKLVTGF